MPDYNEPDEPTGTPPTPPTPTQPRVWDDAYQLDVATRLKALSDELSAVDGTASVRRGIDDARRFLPGVA